MVYFFCLRVNFKSYIKLRDNNHTSQINLLNDYQHSLTKTSLLLKINHLP